MVGRVGEKARKERKMEGGGEEKERTWALYTGFLAYFSQQTWETGINKDYLFMGGFFFPPMKKLRLRKFKEFA